MLDYKTLSDQDLLTLIKEGRQLAFSELYNRYKALLYVHAYRMLNDEEEAKDVVQEMFAVIWTKRETIAITKAVEAYLYSAVRNNILTHISRKKLQAKYVDSLNTFLEGDPVQGDEKLLEKELMQLFEKEIALLPLKMREVFLLSRNDGLSHKQIAEKLDISDKTVKKQISNALKILQIKMHVRLLLFYFF